VAEGAAGAASGAAAAPRGSAPHGASRWDGVALPYPVEASTLALIEAQTGTRSSRPGRWAGGGGPASG
jgi:hypothetical protein